MVDVPAELGPEETYRACDTSAFTFKTTDELPELAEIIGQQRAVSSVEFGMGVGNDGYNIFAVGPAGTGKSSMVYEFLTKQAASLPVPDDWVYVHNFEEPSKPNVIRMEAGRGQKFRKYMENLVEELSVAITQAFDSEDYAKQRQSLVDEYGEREKEQYEALREKAESEGFYHGLLPGCPVPKMDGEACRRRRTRSCPEQRRSSMSMKASTTSCSRPCVQSASGT
jgi:hypothetical protein